MFGLGFTRTAEPTPGSLVLLDAAYFTLNGRFFATFSPKTGAF